MPHAALSAAPADLDRKASDLFDRIAIIDLITHIGLSLDEKRFDNLRSIFTADVVVKRGHSQGRLASTHHLFTDYLIELSGDKAEVRANLRGFHVHRAEAPASHFDIAERYRFEMVRTAEGWRVFRMTTEPVWTAGDAPAG
ncbi:nuclear transport factor 2 family protein [Taklimakanibacter deserti]|uniref:nuclear transport factor 2 family protein n=1 Tax=Taklimakanibacter deserti TaxID=2267839 RepID=UPI0013C44CF1